MSVYDVERNPDFDEMLDEVFPPYKLGELTFYPSEILYNCDPIAYRIDASDWEPDEEDET